MSAEQNKAAVADVLKAFEAGDADVVLARMTDDVTTWCSSSTAN